MPWAFARTSRSAGEGARPDASTPSSGLRQPATLRGESRATRQVRSFYGGALHRPPALAPAIEGSRRASSSLWRFRTYVGPYLTRFVVMLAAMVLAIVVSVVTPLITRALIDGPIAGADRPGLYALGALAVALSLVEVGLVFTRRWIVSIGTMGTETGIRLDLYAKLQRLPLTFHSRWQSGQLLSRIMSDLSTLRRFLGFGMTFLVVNMLQILLVGAVLVRLYWPMGVVVAAAAVPITYLCLRNERVYTRLSRRIQDQTGDVASSVEESLQGLRVIRSFGRSEHVYRQFDERAQALYETSLDRVDNTSKFWTFLEVIPTLTLIVVLGIGAVAASQHHLTLGTLVAFITLMLSLIWPVSSMGFLLSMAQDAMTAADRVAEILDAPETIRDGPLVLDRPTGALRFSHVDFRYPDSGTDALHDVNLVVAPGETVALVGGTGSGKSTLTALVARLADVTGGSVAIDGVDVRELGLVQLRSIVATAFEDPTLFSMSVRENLTLGRPDATDAEVDEAIDVAQAHFVRDLPWGLETRIGEQGMSLSGGQRQRLALARAIVTKPCVLVLDDTLSALDIHTEALVEAALKQVLAGVTGLVVAHRASTVLLADKVAMLSAGTIAHVGTHQELLATVPEYRELLSADFDAEQEFDDLETFGRSA